MYYRKSVLPHRSMSIALNGPSATNGVDIIDSLQVNGRWVPEKGWAAAINYNVRPIGNGSFAAVSLVQKQSSHVSFDSSPSETTIRLLGNFATARVRENSDITYRYQVQLPYGNWPQAAKERQSQFLSLFKSPEDLCDVVIADIARLKQIARDQIPRLENIGVIDSTNASSAEPPIELLAPDRPPSEKIKKELLDQILLKLDAMETAVRENQRQMHAAITKALPLDKLNMLLPD